MSVEVKDLTKTFGTQTAVDHLTFNVQRGGIAGLLGPNGAGKSTCMKMLTCYSAPTEGQAHVCGYNIYEDSINVRRSIGYLPENNPLYDEMYVKEYLAFIAGMYGVKQKTSRVNEMIGITGLEPEKHKKLGMLSKGFRQRVGLAQALIHDPEVLILDEPTAGLDPNQVVEIRDLITNIGREKTVILSSHIMQEVQAMCNRVIILSNGKMVADETTDNLVNRMAGQHYLKVRFKHPVEVQVLQNLNGVEEVTQDGGYWLLRGKDENEMAEAAFHWAADNQNPLFELIREKESLETVFQQLTRQ